MSDIVLRSSSPAMERSAPSKALLKLLGLQVARFSSLAFAAVAQFGARNAIGH